MIAMLHLIARRQSSRLGLRLCLFSIVDRKQIARFLMRYRRPPFSWGTVLLRCGGNRLHCVG
jgi:hypothetical protein